MHQDWVIYWNSKNSRNKYRIKKYITAWDTILTLTVKIDFVHMQVQCSELELWSPMSVEFWQLRMRSTCVLIKQRKLRSDTSLLWSYKRLYSLVKLWCSFLYLLMTIHTSTKLPTKRLTTNLPNVKRAVSLFTRLTKAGVVFSSPPPPIRVCIVFCANLMSI